MLELRDLQFLSALARHRHFAKAASACGVSQPAFSMRIRAMEDRLDTAIVRRGNRFQGLTPEGEAILRHARPILDEMRALEEELSAAKGAVSGALTLAAIPTAAAYAARLAFTLHQAYPGIVPRVITASSLEIQQGVEEGSLDAGLTYQGSVASELVEAVALYSETYLLLTPERLVPPEMTQITWAEAAALPLSLLEAKMQNRAIIDRVFEDLALEPEVVAEASSSSICISIACEGMAATVVPAVILESLGPLEGTRALPLVAPALSKEIALIWALRPHGLPTVEALRGVALGQ